MTVFAIGLALSLLASTTPPAIEPEAGSAAFCSVDDVEFLLSGYVTGGGRLNVNWPDGSCMLDGIKPTCDVSSLPRNSRIPVTLSPEMAWSGPDRIFYGVYSVSSNGSCVLAESAVEGPVTCELWSGDGVTLQIYAPRCTRASGWTACR